MEGHGGEGNVASVGVFPCRRSHHRRRYIVCFTSKTLFQPSQHPPPRVYDALVNLVGNGEPRKTMVHNMYHKTEAVRVSSETEKVN